MLCFVERRPIWKYIKCYETVIGLEMLQYDSQTSGRLLLCNSAAEFIQFRGI